DLIETARPHTYRAQLWYCDPVTPIWRERERYAIRGAAFNWSHATMDHRTAADLVDRMFLCVENSTWLPQHSFEQWSVLYLERHGMARERIFAYIRAFNALIKQRLRHGEATPPD